VRRLMAVVPQHTHLFNVTLRENLTLARPDATEEQIEDAASRSQLHNFALGLPRGYDTPVGEQGLWLSAGERQRVAIARALLKDAPILILDEPAAGLDSLTEMELMHSLRQLMVGRTTLLVTHRLVGLEAMDEILVLRGGREVERGSHDTLLRQGGLYRRSWDLQRELLRQE
jgi:ATP-binding cassette, subfamily C, bacterial CydC